MADSTRLFEGIDQEYQYVEQKTLPYDNVMENASFPVGTTYIPIGKIPGAKQAYSFRKKISGGTVTSVTLQGRKNRAAGFASISVVADNTDTASNVQDYSDFRWEVVIAVSAVVLTLQATFNAAAVKEAV